MILGAAQLGSQAAQLGTFWSSGIVVVGPGDEVTTEDAYFRRAVTTESSILRRSLTGEDANVRRTLTTEDAER